MTIGQPERGTQNGVAALLRDEPGYQLFGDWTDRPNRSGFWGEFTLPQNTAAQTGEVTGQVAGQVAEQVTGQVTGQIEASVVPVTEACSTADLRSAEIQALAGIC
jgi:hypothetical protein